MRHLVYLTVDLPNDVFLLNLYQKVLTMGSPHIFLMLNLTLNDLHISPYHLIVLSKIFLVVIMALFKLVFVLFTGDVGATPRIILMQLLLVQIEARLADDVIF